MLKRARALIAQEETWVQGHYSGAGGVYCAVGALLQAGGRRDRQRFRKAAKCLQEVAESRGFRSMEEMNDRCGHAQVLDAFDAAVAVAKAM